jgi:hypothetical protein
MQSFGIRSGDALPSLAASFGELPTFSITGCDAGAFGGGLGAFPFGQFVTPVTDYGLLDLPPPSPLHPWLLSRRLLANSGELKQVKSDRKVLPLYN